MDEDIKLLSLGSNVEKFSSKTKETNYGNPKVTALCNLHEYAKNLAQSQEVKVKELDLILALLEAMIVQQIEETQE